MGAGASQSCPDPQSLLEPAPPRQVVDAQVFVTVRHLQRVKCALLLLAAGAGMTPGQHAALRTAFVQHAAAQGILAPADDQARSALSAALSVRSVELRKLPKPSAVSHVRLQLGGSIVVCIYRCIYMHFCPLPSAVCQA